MVRHVINGSCPNHREVQLQLSTKTVMTKMDFFRLKNKRNPDQNTSRCPPATTSESPGFCTRRVLILAALGGTISKAYVPACPQSDYSSNEQTTTLRNIKIGSNPRHWKKNNDTCKLPKTVVTKLDYPDRITNEILHIIPIIFLLLPRARVPASAPG